jgi:hypothetical protein
MAFAEAVWGRSNQCECVIQDGYICTDYLSRNLRHAASYKYKTIEEDRTADRRRRTIGADSILS